ncbi:MAG: hypothetical protein CEE38_08610 [Planctomycetes bacterium B3_Pla]|nr:MAG: hypothetical protein CEE38_08610 [Planctomycetes bacterium B3_Pla]
MKFETVDTPQKYLSALPEGVTLGKKMQVWYVQKTSTDIKGAVSRLIYPKDAPDAEAIMLGFAPPKRYGAVGIGRHGNVLQWGYAASPSEMTPAGRNLFINCIAYIRKFDGKRSR